MMMMMMMMMMKCASSFENYRPGRPSFAGVQQDVAR